MREDSRVEIYAVSLLGLVLVVNLVYAFWKGSDERDWEARWASLDDLDRAWLAAASRASANRAALEERGELDLAKGFGRREARRRAYIALAILPPFIIVAVLILIGLVSDRDAYLLFGPFALLQSIVVYRRDRQIKNRYRETRDRYLAARGPESEPTT